jgi:hypothetical protein
VPIILTLNGQDVTIRQPDAYADIHTTTQILKKGDSVLHKGVRQTVDVTPSIRTATALVGTTQTPTSRDASSSSSSSLTSTAVASAPSTTSLAESKAEKKAKLELERARLLAELDALNLDDEDTSVSEINK